MKHIFALFYLLLFPICFSFSQQGAYPIENNILNQVESVINKNFPWESTSWKPILKIDSNCSVKIDSALTPFICKNNNLIVRHLFYENTLVVDKPDFKLTVDPAMNFSYGRELISDSVLKNNIRGVLINGQIGKNFYFQSVAVENQSFFPEYSSKYILEHHIIPGTSRTRLFKKSGFDYSYAYGNISYSPTKWFNFQFGNDKNFVGEGYRSLLISDAFAYLTNAKFTISLKKIKYVYMMAVFQDVTYNDNKQLIYKRNHGTFSYLDWALLKQVHLGFFESTVWKTSGNGFNNKFNINFFNPVIYSKLIQNGLNDSNNVIIGWNLKLIPAKFIEIYSQYVIDNFDKQKNSPENKTAYQVGLKLFEPLNIHNFFILGEYNHIRPFIYSHEIERQNYTHSNQPIAHPAGANLREWIIKADYRLKRWMVGFKYIDLVQGLDSVGFVSGSNVFNTNSNQQASFLQGEQKQLKYLNLEISYLINPSNRMNLFLSVDKRVNTFKNKTDNTIAVLFGIRTSFRNEYFDFY